MKNLMHLGEILNKEEQQSINGGHAGCEKYCQTAQPGAPSYEACGCCTIQGVPCK